MSLLLTVSNRFLRRMKAAGLPRIRFHDLRHTHTTQLIESGANPKVVRLRLGHTSVAFTLQRYTRPDRESDARAAQSFAKLIDNATA